MMSVALHHAPVEPSRAGAITAMIWERPTCLLCLAAKVGVTPRDAACALEWIASVVRFNARDRAHCSLCDCIVGPVYSLPRQEGAAPDAGRMSNIVREATSGTKDA